MLNSISKTVAYATQLVPQLSNVNLQNYIHVAEYPNEHNIRYAEIRERLCKQPLLNSMSYIHELFFSISC
jgi:hypothetical protein